jgi:recombination protein RecA
MAKVKKVAKKITSAGDPKALDNALSQIEKDFGAGSIMLMDSSKNIEIEGLSTGALSLDIALGGKGFPRGRIVELYGPESSGKTTLALTCVAQAQKEGGVCAFIDAEHALDPVWVKTIGVNTESLLVSQPESGEQALNIVETLVKSNAVDLIVIDSVAALIPQAELNGEIGDSHVGLQARMMSQAMRKLTGCISKTKTSLIFINQIREKIGVMFGSPETTPGGRALKFYSSVRVDIRRISTIKDSSGTATGNNVRVRVVKNKVAPPFKEAIFDIMFNEGVSITGDLIDLGVDRGILKKAGAWISYGEMQIGMGREKAKAFLKETPELADEIREKIMDIEAGVDIEDTSETTEAKEAKDATEATKATKPKVKDKK